MILDRSTNSATSFYIVVFFQVDDNGTSPLHAAARAGRPLLVELFLNFDRHSADLVDVEGRTALHIAAMFGHQVTLFHY